MKKEIFIIDDDPIYRMIVSRTINKIGPSLTINQCENGEIGLAMLQSERNTTHEIVVLLDINMPILNGWGFLDEIKKSNFFNILQLKIYIVSSSTDESDLLKSKQYDLEVPFYHKPLAKEDIKTIIGFE